MKKILSYLLLLIPGACVNAQVDLQNTGILYLTGSSDVLYINGSFTNASGSALTNGGNIYLLRNLTNNQSSMSAGTGTLYLNGSVAQSINGSQSFRTFNLVTNNTSTGITLNNNLSVSGAHTFVDGIITTSATPNYLVYEAGSSYSGDGDGQHVNGWVKKLGTTNFSFPVGNGTVIRKAAIESLSGTLEFNARYLAPTPSPGSRVMPLVLIDPNEYWEINRVSGSGSAQIHLNWDFSRVAFPQYNLTAIRVSRQDAGLWTDRDGSATGDVTTTGDVTSSTLSAFGNFTFGSVEFMIPLKFLGITGQRKNGYNLVEWKTADAFDTDHFEIERSEDGIHFRSIGTMASINSPVVLTYTFRDAQLTGGTLWYRVRSVDIDGKYTLSPVVSVRDQSTGVGAMYVLNNPAQGSIRLYAPESYRGRCEYYITSTSGQLIQKGTMQVNGAGNVSIKLQAAVTQGVYILQVRKDKLQFKERILIQ